MRKRNIAGSVCNARAGSRHSRMQLANVSARPSRRSAARSRTSPPSDEIDPPAKSAVRLVYDDLTLKGEFARTTRVWPGTFNPGMPQFAASKVTSLDIGARYRHGTGAGPVDLSAEFSRLVAGPDGASWERQDQFVLGAAWFARPSAKLFAEYTHVEGYTPLNFLGGGSVRDDRGEVVPDRTHSDSSARSDVILIGVNVAF